MRRIINLKFALLFLAGISLGGCGIYSKIVLFNNSDIDLKIQQGRNTIVVEPHGYIEYVMIWSDIQYLYIEKKGAIISCIVPAVPNKFLEKHLIFDYYRFQFEPSWEIFVVQPGTNFPVREVPIQPDGYPITVDEDKCTSFSRQKALDN